jgi:acyl carrier protein
MPMANPANPKDLSDSELAAAVESSVRQFLKDEGGADNAQELAADAPLWAEFDSLLVMELLVHLEGQFGVQLNTGKLNPDDLKTIGRIRDVATKAIRAAQKP